MGDTSGILSSVQVNRHDFGCSSHPSELLVIDTDMNHWYLRYRWGCLWVCKNTYHPDEAVAHEVLGGKYDGHMSSDAMCEHTGLDLTMVCPDCNGSGKPPAADIGIFQLGALEPCETCKGEKRIVSPRIPDWFAFEALSNGIKSALSRLQSDDPE